MQLNKYLDLLTNILDSRRDVDLEHFWVDHIESGQSALVEGRLRFWDGSLLKFIEVVQQRGAIVGKLEYVYHYQDAGDRLVFRYDNSPHHPEILTFPHHKHVARAGQRAESIEPASVPHLGEVLREIDRILQRGAAD
jgi:hypothetical protein